MSQFLTEALNRMEYLITEVPNILDSAEDSCETTLKKYRAHIEELSEKATDVRVFTAPKDDGSKPVPRAVLHRAILLLEKSVWKIQSWVSYETSLKEQMRDHRFYNQSGLIVVENA